MASLSAWILTDGKAGDEIPCFGLAAAMGLTPECRLIAPRGLFAALSPWGPIDVRDRPSRANSPLRPPFPDIAFASGRRTVPYLRHLKQASGRRTFTVFLKDPRIGTRAADVIWVPAHDSLRGPNVLVSATAPHTLSSEILAAARAAPDPRIAALASPRVALLVGGPSRHHSFSQMDQDRLVELAALMLSQGASLAVTGSRRTPPALLERLRGLKTRAGHAFVWDGSGANPYASMLALADRIIVTADSTNMVGEAVATAAPVHIFEPSGGHPRLDTFIEGLIGQGRVRRWAGRLEDWPVQPIDATPVIAAEIAVRYARFQQGLSVP